MQGPWSPIPGDIVRVRYGAQATLADNSTVEMREPGPYRVTGADYVGAASGRGRVTLEGVGTLDEAACEVQKPSEGPQAEAEALRPSWRGGPGGWEGVLKDRSGAVVWRCGHRHPNRDLSSRYKSAALSCASSERHRRILVARHGEEQGQRFYERALETGKHALCGR